MGQHWLLPPCAWRVMIWGESWGGEEAREQDAGGRGMTGGVGVTVAAAERGHLPFLVGAAIDCLGAPR